MGRAYREPFGDRPQTTPQPHTPDASNLKTAYGGGKLALARLAGRLAPPRTETLGFRPLLLISDDDELSRMLDGHLHFTSTRLIPSRISSGVIGLLVFISLEEPTAGKLEARKSRAPRRKATKPIERQSYESVGVSRAGGQSGWWHPFLLRRCWPRGQN